MTWQQRPVGRVPCRPPALLEWGRNDAFVQSEGARAYLNGLPDAVFRLLGTGHSVTATHSAEIAALIRAFLSRVVAPAAARGAGANQRRARSDQPCRAGGQASSVSYASIPTSMRSSS